MLARDIGLRSHDRARDSEHDLRELPQDDSCPAGSMRRCILSCHIHAVSITVTPQFQDSRMKYK